LTKVKQADKYADLLKGYYEKQLAKIKSALEKVQEKLMEELNEKNELAQKLADDYKELLGKREQYAKEKPWCCYHQKRKRNFFNSHSIKIGQICSGIKILGHTSQL
jgi:uncharacterized membrane-anchored protein YhcB (DUF1043 family)